MTAYFVSSVSINSSYQAILRGHLPVSFNGSRRRLLISSSTFAFPDRRLVRSLAASSRRHVLDGRISCGHIESSINWPSRRCLELPHYCSFVASFGHFAAQSLDNSPSNPFLLHNSIHKYHSFYALSARCACLSLEFLLFYNFDEHSRTTQYILATNFTLRSSFPWPQLIPVRGYIRMRVTSIIRVIIILRY